MLLLFASIYLCFFLLWFVYMSEISSQMQCSSSCAGHHEHFGVLLLNAIFLSYSSTAIRSGRRKCAHISLASTINAYMYTQNINFKLVAFVAIKLMHSGSEIILSVFFFPSLLFFGAIETN